MKTGVQRSVVFQSRRAFLIGSAAGAGMLCIPFSLRRALGQERKVVSKLATIVAVDAQTIYAKDAQGPVTVKLGPAVQVWKKTVSNDFSRLGPGDQILVRGYNDAAGNLVASGVWANIVSYYGMIVGVSGNQYQMALYQPGPTEIIKTIMVDTNTLGWDGRPLSQGDIIKGRFVQTVGYMTTLGAIEAVRAIIYENGRPLHMAPNAAIKTPRGKIPQQ